MPFKRPNSKYYRIRKLNLPGYGRLGQVSCRVTSKAVAWQMERLVERIAEKGLVDPSWHSLLDALKAGKLTLPDLLKAKNEGRLQELRRAAQDPTIQKAIDQYLATDPDYITERGLRLLQKMAERELGKDARFSALCSGKIITLLCARAKREGGERGDGTLSHNSVHRMLHGPVSKLLRFHLGSAERDRIFADVDFARKDDTRDVWLDGSEISRLLDSCEGWFRPMVLTALATGGDRSPLMRLRVRDVQVEWNEEEQAYQGLIYLRDSKTDSRPRSVAIVDPVCRALLPLLKEKGPDDHVFEGPPDPAKEGREPITKHQVRYWFEKAREKADLEHVRFKDLRRTWAVNADEAGLNLGQLKSGLGHGLHETTVRYTNRQVTLAHGPAKEVARQMGLLSEKP